jgi:hypothetical protein
MTDLSTRLHHNLRQWVVQADRALTNLENLELRKEAHEHFRKLRSLHTTLAAELDLWKHLGGKLPEAKEAATRNLSRKMRTVNVSQCIRFSGVAGTKLTSCCGGQTKEVPSYYCTRHGEVTLKDCQSCRSYIENAENLPTTKSDFLLTSSDCSDCTRIKECLDATTAAGRTLSVMQVTDARARKILDSYGLEEAYVPCLIEDHMVGKPVETGKWTDDPYDIVERLEARGFLTPESGYPVGACVYAKAPVEGTKGAEWHCSAFGNTVRKMDCRTCGDFLKCSDLHSRDLVHLLVCCKGSQVCEDIVTRVDVGGDSNLHIYNADTSKDAVDVLEKYGHDNVSVPVLFESMNLETGECVEVVSGFDKIMDRLWKWDYLG